MSYSIVIPSRNGENLRACLTALRAAGEKGRVIVVDDGVEWNGTTTSWTSQYDDDGRASFVTAGISPFVFSRNCNIGIKAAGRDDVVLLNDDALLDEPPEPFPYRQRFDWGESGPPDRFVPTFGRLQQVCIEHLEIGIIAATTNLTGQALQQPRGKGIRIVPHFAFVCVYIPRRTIDLVGMLDERYCLGYGCEDRDYCESVNRAGLKCAVHDYVYVDHSKLKSSFRGAPTAGGDFSRNYKLLMEKWGTLAE